MAFIDFPVVAARVALGRREGEDVVEDDVGPQDAPLCGFDLGPLLSWLNCVPQEPPAVTKEYDPNDDSWKDRK